MNLSDLSIGDEVLFIGGGAYDRFEAITKIVRITPTGRIRVDRNPEIQFNKHGREIGNSGIGAARICVIDDKKREELRKKSVVKFALDELEKMSFALKNTGSLSENYEKAVRILTAFGIEFIGYGEMIR